MTFAEALDEWGYWELEAWAEAAWDLLAEMHPDDAGGGPGSSGDAPDMVDLRKIRPGGAGMTRGG